MVSLLLQKNHDEQTPLDLLQQHDSIRQLLIDHIAALKAESNVSLTPVSDAQHPAQQEPKTSPNHKV
jgi:hypothetical protein